MPAALVAVAAVGCSEGGAETGPAANDAAALCMTYALRGSWCRWAPLGRGHGRLEGAKRPMMVRGMPTWVFADGVGRAISVSGLWCEIERCDSVQIEETVIRGLGFVSCP